MAIMPKINNSYMKMFLETEVLVNGDQLNIDSFNVERFNGQSWNSMIEIQAEKMGLTVVDECTFESTSLQMAEEFSLVISEFNTMIEKMVSPIPLVFDLTTITNLCHFNENGDLVREQIK